MFESDDNIYKTLYYELFNSITDALNCLSRQNYKLAAVVLETAQHRAEDMYIHAGDEPAQQP